LFQGAAESALRDNLGESSAQWMMEDAEAHAVADQCAEARREISAGLELSRDNFTLERASRALAFCLAGDDASSLSRELADRFANATLTTRLHLPVSAATVAVQRGESARALQLLDGVKPYDHAPASEFWPIYLRGMAHLHLKDGRAAGVEFQSILDHRGEAPTSPLYALAHVGIARAAVLSGSVDQARKAYERFFALWDDADPNLPPLKDARQEYARLR
jgi:hypothetical protein